MNRSSLRADKRGSFRRALSLERFESRLLLAGDLCDSFGLADQVVETDRVIAADAGMTPSTAYDLGAIDGTRALSGSLGWFDYVDMFRFTIERDADVEIELSRMFRDADLYLLDDAGNLIGRSTASGSRNDSISGGLDTGNYTVAVVAASYGSNRYRLSVSADLAEPQPLPPQPEPVTQPQPPGNGNPTGGVPLADVAYFGGSREWGLNAVGAPEAWAAGYTGAGITVAVIDTGVDLDHPDLVHSIYVNPGEIPGNGIDDDQNGYVDDVHGYDFAANDANPNDTHGHGTHVAGTIAAANNGFGATGVAPDVTVLPIRVLGDDGSGSSLDVAAGIRYAADLGAEIINLSLGGGFSRAIEGAIDYAHSLGSLIVAAAGNEGASLPGYPARFSATNNNVISVGAYSSSGTIAGFSNDVGNSGAVQIDAPGVGIYSTYVGGSYATLSGTSMATPHVAGLAALTLSSNPDLTAPELRQLLATTANGQASGSDSTGLADARSAIGRASSTVGVSSTMTTLDHDAGARSRNYLVRDLAAIDFAVKELTETDESHDALHAIIPGIQIGDLRKANEMDRLASFAWRQEDRGLLEILSGEKTKDRSESQLESAWSEHCNDLA